MANEHFIHIDGNLRRSYKERVVLLSLSWTREGCDVKKKGSPFKVTTCVEKKTKKQRFSLPSVVHLKSDLILASKGSFSTPEPSLSWSVMWAKTLDLGTKIALVSARWPLF